MLNVKVKTKLTAIIFALAMLGSDIAIAGLESSLMGIKMKLVSISKKASESSSGAIFANSFFQSLPSTQPGVSFSYAGSLVVRAGGAGGN